MIAGQVLDLQAEGRKVALEEVRAIHQSKTAALFSASVWTGAYLGGGSAEELAAVGAYAERVGLAFQIVDDILDATDGKDRDLKKATWPSVIGLEESRTTVRNLTSDASRLVLPLGDRARILVQIADFLETRSN
jgi:geranylgeranyl diphosphate synthase type II